jgi:dTDP-glucose 4,6-dehydratase
MRVLVTGGSGFIGSAVVRRLVHGSGMNVLNLDALTYAATAGTLADLDDDPRYRFVHADVRNAEAVARAFMVHRPDAVVHLAAETHVDRSIDDPDAFVETNVRGTSVMLDTTLRHWRTLDDDERRCFRFVHISTDEVFGSLGPTERFREDTPYAPRSPYAASKAAADHLVRAWGHTYGLPVVIGHSSNNYGPFQHPEKLIPHTIINGVAGRPLPVYGQGDNVRDWLHVEDHARAIELLLRHGRPHESYAIGGENERTNIDVVRRICAWLDILAPDPSGLSRSTRIVHVEDRPGHDLRYALDPAKIGRELGWRPEIAFDDGLGETVGWYLAHRSWWTRILQHGYRGERLGLGRTAAAVAAAG